MLNGSGKKGHPRLELNEKAFSFSPYIWYSFFIFLITLGITLMGFTCWASILKTDPIWLWGIMDWFANIMLSILAIFLWLSVSCIYPGRVVHDPSLSTVLVFPCVWDQSFALQLQFSNGFEESFEYFLFHNRLSQNPNQICT
jgi:hypothetical protein